MLQGLIALNQPGYTSENWHGTLLVVGIIIFSVVFNTVLAVRLPLIEGILLVLHVAGLFAIVIPLWVMGPRGNAHQLLLEWVDGGGWGDKGLSAMIGLPVMVSILYVSVMAMAFLKMTPGTSVILARTIANLGLSTPAGL